MVKQKWLIAAVFTVLTALFIDNLGATATATSFCAPVTTHTTSVTPNTTYNAYFNQQAGPGWVGGDASYQTKLPDGRMVWVFSDTMIGTATTSGTASFTGMPHNTMLVGTGAKLKSLYSGGYSTPKSLIPDTTVNGQPAWWYVSATYVEGKTLLVYVNQMTGQPGDIFATPTGASKIAVFSVPTTSSAVPQFQKLVAIASDATTQWGNGYTFDTTYNYIYGLTTDHQMKLARVKRGSSVTLSAWQFWNGSAWVAGESNAAIVNSTQAEAVSPQPSSWGNGYVAISTSQPFGNYLQQQFACSPQGPWSAPENIYTIPETWGTMAGYHDIMAYIPNVVGNKPNDSTSLIVSYNINTTDGFAALAQNINQYRPRFVTVK